MARGQNEKKIVFDKILEQFEGAFSPDGKVIRIPISGEDGVVEIKVALTAAKDVLSCGNADPVEPQMQNIDFNIDASAPTEEEKQNVANLLERLGI